MGKCQKYTGVNLNGISMVKSGTIWAKNEWTNNDYNGLKSIG